MHVVLALEEVANLASVHRAWEGDVLVLAGSFVVPEHVTKLVVELVRDWGHRREVGNAWVEHLSGRADGSQEDKRVSAHPAVVFGVPDDPVEPPRGGVVE